jgi:hypothetical protein
MPEGFGRPVSSLDFELIRCSDMTVAMPVRVPHSKGFYATVAILTTLVGLAFLLGAFAKSSFAGVLLDTPMVWRLVQAGIAAIFLIGAMQAFERWLSPARAQARSAAISDVARARVLILCRVLAGIGIVGWPIAGVVHQAGVRPDVDIGILSTVLLFAGFLVADLCG